MSIGVAVAGDLAVGVTEKKIGKDKDVRSGPRPLPIPLSASGEVDRHAYEVKIENRSFQPYRGIEARYILFVKRRTLTMPDGAARPERVFGRESISEIPARGKHLFETSGVELREVEIDPDAARASRGQRSAADELAGIWVRVYRGNELVAEFTRPTNLATKETWQDAPPERRAGAAGRRQELKKRFVPQDRVSP